VIVQRALAAKNVTHAKAGTVLAGFLKIFPMFIMVFPGMISRLLFPGKFGTLLSSISQQVSSDKLKF